MQRMWRIIPESVLIVVVASLAGGACAMESPSIQRPACRVVDGDKLPAESGGAAALCTAIQRAAAARAPGVEFTVDVKVLSSSRLAATVTSEGQRLPEHNFASMDRDLTGNSFERFAAALADQLAQR
ncbi:hypothetical protein [Sphingomonas sp.]|uniref:hypothetical protein n=1 Tax=Sphingomonas sp. TaxID=28214 RepID=UPI0017CD7A49|nr:hypothetical protein [Sphingomonas sp.]MBA3511197.1 hypothetical protein [Sphingomonas sp.]